MGKVVYKHHQTKAQKKIDKINASRAEMQYIEEKAAFDAKRKEEKQARLNKGEYTFWEKFGLMIIGGAVFVCSLTLFSSNETIVPAILGLIAGIVLALIGLLKFKKIKKQAAAIKEEAVAKAANTFVACPFCGAQTHDGEYCEYCGGALH